MTELPTFSCDEIIATSVQSNTCILGSGDTHLYKNFLGEEQANKLYNDIMKNIDFQQWYHMPGKNKLPLPLKRVKRIITSINSDGSVPYYRFTINDQNSHGLISPMPSVIQTICDKVNSFLGIEFNHVVILLYRDGDDSIGFHKDKTLDLDEKSPIVSLSLGETRTYCLRDNIYNPTQNQEIELINDTLLVLGPQTNENFYHSIKPCDEGQLSEPRISITFRKAMTFKLPDGMLIGKGAKYQTLNWPEELNGTHIVGYGGKIEK